MNIGNVWEKLYRIVEERKKEMPEGSYTAFLFQKGEDRILQKVGEEAVETILALKSGNREHAVYEISDLIYHLTVALVEKGISLDEIAQELSKRMKP
jgi:phosphoribosyl-ATP pyrophosphohydrolase